MRKTATAFTFALSLACGVSHGEGLPRVIAHRGASKDAPENTLAAFRLAWEQEADGIEIDVQVTRDGHVVCIHDADTKKVAGQKLVVRDSTLVQLRGLDVGSWHDVRFRGERIPTLAEVLETVPAGKRVYLDIKAGAEIIAPLVAAMRASQVKPEQVGVLAFDAAVIREIKKQAPELKAHWLCQVRKNALTGKFSPSQAVVLQTLRECGADGLASRHSDISDAFIRGILDEGFEHRVWTVNCEKMADRFAKLGTTSIITDEPSRIRMHLRR
jgi:glycerophosphoryl diester phosphodiesterase